MIEEIKKEIKRTAMVYMIVPANITEDENYRSDVATTLKLFDEILDKYNKQDDYLIIDKKMFRTRVNNQLCEDIEPDCEDYWLASIEHSAEELEKYKAAWEELPKLFAGTTHLGKLQMCQEQLKQKHGIGE